MIDIIALIFLTRNIGALAKLKGQVPGRWKLYVVLYWFCFLIFGAAVGVLISKNLYMAGLLAYGCAFGGYLLARHRLESIPDSQDEHWMDRIGRQDR